MTTASSILGIVPGLQAMALVGHNLTPLKNFGKGPKIGTGFKPMKQMVRLGTANLVGVGLIKPTAQMINAL